ncbi:MAG TPA: CHRD domain-containing protein [Myxococcaceae bacterium]|jgi:hypothetical protein
MKANRLFIACVATVALAACGGSTELTATLSGEAQKPAAVNTPATGSAKVTVDGSKLSISGSFKDLSSNTAGAHIHGPTDANGVGPVFCHLSVPTGNSGSIGADGPTSPKCSDKELSDTDISNFEAGKFYVNIHSANFKDGEIRGDLKKVE